MGELNVADYERMWTTERNEWRLLRVRDGDVLLPIRSGEPPRALIIEDEGLAQSVVAKMVAAGVPVSDEL